MLIGWGALVERAPHPLLNSRACLRILGDVILFVPQWSLYPSPKLVTLK
jgi:hypothetical protein